MPKNKSKHEAVYRFFDQQGSGIYTLFESYPESVFLMDRVGTILDFNEKFASRMGKSRQECLGKNVYDLLPHDIAALRRIKAEEAFRTGKRLSFEDERNGCVLLHNVYPCHSPEGEVSRLFIIAEDITDYKRTEYELKYEQTFSKALIDATPGVFCVLDANGRLTAWNPFLRDEIVCKSEKEMKGTLAIDYIHPEDRSSVLMHIKGVLDSDIEVSSEARVFLRGGPEFRWMLFKGKRIIINGNNLMIGIGSDITERKLAENQLNKLSAAVEQGPAGIVITDSVGITEYVNPRFTELTGYSFEEAKGEYPPIFKPGLLPDTHYKKFRKTIASGKIWHGELLNKKKNGELFWEASTVSSIKNREGVITNFLVIKEDITDKKKLLDELIAAKEKAEESERLKTAFLANMSHEIRTPMNGILGFSELLKEPFLSGDEMAEYIDLIQKSGERMLNLINDLFDISRIDAHEVNLQITETPLNELLRDIHAFFRHEAESKGLQLTFSAGLTNSESIIKTDSVKLNQILTNLVKNALKFTHKGGIDFGYIRKNGILEFYVIDSGIGIPVEMIEKVFDRFRQVDITLTRGYEGAGLGLSITRAFVEMLGGSIRVESVEGEGSKFFFTLEYIPSGSQKIPHSLLVNEEQVLTIPGLNILIAEDDEVSTLLLKKSLRGDNVHILYAENGPQAVELVKRHSEINIVLMDIKMPLLNGYEATRQIKHIRPSLPVIAQTAFASREDRQKARDAGCDCFLTKPINKNNLLELMQVLLKR
jgi:PAS domain S-box-containing protein